MATNAVAGPSKANGNGKAATPLTKNAKRRLKKKQQQQQEPQASSSSIAATPSVKQEPDANYDDEAEASTSIIHQAADFRIDPDSEVYKAFSNVLSRYQPETLSQQQQPSKGEIIYSDDELESAHSDADEGDGLATSHSLSKRKQKKLSRLTVAELKQLVPKPEVVEWTDVTSSDPRLLVHLKSTRNTVPIPPHWSHKRDYLQHKRGIEKPPYTLPAYISDTGIATMKDALKEKEGEYSLKQKTRERVQPKMGKMEIDYQRLWDAFFKFQTKPELSGYGDTYYEGKEYENKYKEKRPGMLSAELIEALSIPPDAPPPWLIAMQRFGPPPSYPHLQIPGLNAPIPQGASWGFHPGGWGRPPVDEYGNPLYANVLANIDGAVDDELVDKVEREHWGMLEVEESDPEEEEEEEEEPEEEETQQVDLSGVQSVTSTSAGLETPSFTQLRKDERVSDSHPRSLYQVLPERTASGGQNQFLASERLYDLSSAQHPSAAAATGPTLGAEDSRANKRAAASDQIQLSMDPDSLDQEQQLAERYDAERKAQGSARFGGLAGKDQEGVSEMRQQLQDERRKEDERRVKQRRG